VLDTSSNSNHSNKDEDELDVDIDIEIDGDDDDEVDEDMERYFDIDDIEDEDGEGGDVEIDDRSDLLEEEELMEEEELHKYWGEDVLMSCSSEELRIEDEKRNAAIDQADRISSASTTTTPTPSLEFANGGDDPELHAHSFASRPFLKEHTQLRSSTSSLSSSSSSIPAPASPSPANTTTTTNTTTTNRERTAKTKKTFDDSTTSRIREILTEQFDREIAYKRQELQLIDQRLAQAEALLLKMQEWEAQRKQEGLRASLSSFLDSISFFIARHI